jgi:hypothetical protein
VRYDLGASAEARDEPALALRYWRDLSAPPGVHEGEWLVRLARQRWRVAPEDPGVAQLGRLYSAHPRLPAAVVEVAARYAEELGASGESVAARRLLEALTPHAAFAHSHSFFMILGSAYERAGDLALAAESYLHSALAGNRADTDAVVARLRAGMALARAGYARDARAQLQWVLTHARDSARIETARRALQELQP